MQYTGTNPWYSKYENIPYKHLGINPTTGLDCFNLCRYIIEKECNKVIPYTSGDNCNIADENWYQKTTKQLMINKAMSDVNWQKVSKPQIFDIILMSIGATNISNHCALYVENNKIIQMFENRPSYTTIYGNYYKQYTTGIYRWIG